MNPSSKNSGAASDIDLRLERLLRAAAPQDETPATAPFGFDTRVVALWRGQKSGGSNGMIRLVRRVALLAVAIIVVAAAGAYREALQNEESNEPFANEFAMADYAIQDEVAP
jgi:hypothetical protein